jgi:hypothetical protein
MNWYEVTRVIGSGRIAELKMVSCDDRKSKKATSVRGANSAGQSRPFRGCELKRIMVESSLMAASVAWAAHDFLR